jgi:hypothetical protein
MSQLMMSELGETAAPETTKPTLGLNGLLADTKARQDKLLADLDFQARILRELIAELRELNRGME